MKAKSMLRYLLLLVLGLVAFGGTYALVSHTNQVPPGMVWIPGGRSTMGTDSDLGWPDEKPAHRVRVNGFWMDETDVTNAQFRKFVEATSYVTTAEKPMDTTEILQQLAARHAAASKGESRSRLDGVRADEWSGQGRRP